MNIVRSVHGDWSCKQQVFMQVVGISAQVVR